MAAVLLHQLHDPVALVAAGAIRALPFRFPGPFLVAGPTPPGLRNRGRRNALDREARGHAGPESLFCLLRRTGSLEPRELGANSRSSALRCLLNVKFYRWSGVVAGFSRDWTSLFFHIRARPSYVWQQVALRAVLST